MATKKKLLQAAAGTAAAGGAGLNVEEVFSTYLYEGTGAAQTITNGIDLDGEGGLLWLKVRDQNRQHWLVDSERDLDDGLSSNETGPYIGYTNRVNSFNTNGFTVGTQDETNANGEDYASWTFRKAPKFFDVVSWTGDGTNPRNISHNLGSVPGCFIVKCTSGTTDWRVYHRGLSSPELNNLFLHNTNAVSGTSHWSNTAPTDTHFTVSNHANVNASGSTYVAYLFAHNDGDGEFGSEADADIIKCGSYTGNGSTDGPEIDLGFEPQWLLIKNATTGNTAWSMWDNMRGVVTGGNDAYLQPSASSAEASYNGFAFTPTGFKVENTAGFINTSGNTYIYIAIRRGPMAVPTDATEVFSTTLGTNTSGWTYDAGFPVDWTLYTARTGGDNFTFNRMTGSKYLTTNSTLAENSYTVGFDNMSHVDISGSNNNGFVIWDWKRAPSFFDVVAYTGTGSARTVSHNLGVAPEMMWIKQRNTVRNWAVYHSGTGNTKQLELNTSDAAAVDTHWNNTTPTSTEFTLGTNTRVNESAGDYIAYLFASVDGVSKVGSYTGNGTSQNIDCGFSSGARFVLIKRSSNAQDWYIFDSTRGIVSGNDPYLKLNTTDSEAIATDEIDPLSSGFTVHQTGSAGINFNGHTYIFYAIA